MPLLSAEELTKSFGDTRAIDQVSFQGEPGEILGLLGPNGAGKTTAIRCLSTLLAPDHGRATIAGHRTDDAPAAVRQSIGVLTTDIGVYERFSGRENLRYFADLYGLSGEARERRIADLAALLQMSDFLDRRAGTYSTGMKQKLAIARAVIHDPPVVCFDEPTAGLDVLASRTVLGFMTDARAAKKCVLFSTHRLVEAEKLCDRVVIIHQGRVIASGTVAELRARTGAADLEDAFLSLIGVKV